MFLRTSRARSITVESGGHTGKVARALTALNDSGLLVAAMDEFIGGMQLPQVVNRACFAWFQAANLATSAYPLLTTANASRPSIRCRLASL